MHILLFIIYGVACCYGIYKIPFIRRSGIKTGVLWVLFGLHVATGLIHNIIAWRYYPGHGDVWSFYNDSFEVRYQLTHRFDLFLSDNKAWVYIRYNAIIWIEAILNLFSYSSLTVNTLLFSFPVFLGNIALFRMLRVRFSGDMLIPGCVFLLPGTLFWTSCIHREGVLYMLLGFLFYTFDKILSGRYPRRKIWHPICCFLLIIWIRPIVAVPLLPALTLWWALEKPLSGKQWWLMTAGCISALIILPLLIPGLFQHIADGITTRQREFLAMEGHSRLPLPAMDGTFTGMLHVLPTAIRNGWFEPLPGSGGRPIYLAFSLELMLIWIIAATALIRGKLLRQLTPFSCCCLLFALTAMLLIGAVVPFAGAIVRYRSIYLPFLLIPCLAPFQSYPIYQKINKLLTHIIK